MEKLELKDRLKSLSKKTLLEGLHSRQNSQSGPTLSDKDSAAMTQRVDSLKEALTHVKEENTRLIAQTTMVIDVFNHTVNQKYRYCFTSQLTL